MNIPLIWYWPRRKMEVPEISSAKSTVAQAIKEEAQATKKIDARILIALDVIVENQGIPYEENMQNAKARTKGVNL